MRELNQNSLPDKSWTSRHLVYTHGYGAVAAAADQVNDDEPSFVLNNIPASGELDLNEKYTDVYYGEDFSDYAVVGTKVTEQQAVPPKEGAQPKKYAGSGGDCFPYYFKEMGIGPIIGMRTWGGLVGISHNLPLVDGGSVTMPDFGMWDPKTEQWVVENHGVDPDIEVENPPSALVAGHDPQLERAIQWSLDQLEKNPPKRPERPRYKVQKGLPETSAAR